MLQSISTRSFVVILALAAFVCNQRYAWAAPPVTVQTSPEDLASKRAKLAEQITRLSGSDEEAAQEQSEASSQAQEELDLLKTLDLLFLQHQATFEQRRDIERAQKGTQDELNTLRTFGPPEAKPYSFLLLEDTRDQLAAEEARQEVTQSDLTGAEQLLEAAREWFDESEQDRRAAQEALDENDQADQEAELTRDVKLAELDSAISRQTVALRRSEIEVKTMRLAACELRQTLLSEKVELLAKDARFTEQDFNTRWKRLKNYSRELKKKLAQAEARLQGLAAQKAQAERELDEQEADKAVTAAAEQAFALATRVLHDEITLINRRLRELEQFRHFWEGRYEVVSGKADKEGLEDWRDNLNEFLERVAQAERSLSLRLDEIRLDQATLVGRSVESGQNDQMQKWVDFQLEHLQRLAELCENSLLHLKASQRSAERFLEDLDERIEPEGRRDWIGPVRESLLSFWNYELASVDDRPITVGKIISAVAYVLIGILIARLISRLLGNRILPRLGMNEGAAHAVRSISFYALSLLFGLLSLELVNLPFAAFTFLGGAAAIGIGFGSQSILNNFISGLILLAEQPIRVGDLVEIDGIQGTVEHIGARSTRVKTSSNHEIVFPNSKLLENKVTNLTLSDDLVQTAIGISLSPSMTVDQVRESLLVAASSHPKVLASPGPVVLFKEFSGASMKFELHFWLKLHDVMECRIVESDVREKINDLFCHTDAATTLAVTRPALPVAGKISPPAKSDPLPLREAG